jgi:hypothetical protein
LVVGAAADEEDGKVEALVKEAAALAFPSNGDPDERVHFKMARFSTAVGLELIIRD